MIRRLFRHGNKVPKVEKQEGNPLIPSKARKYECGFRVLNGDHAKMQARVAFRLYVLRVESLAGVVSNLNPKPQTSSGRAADSIGATVPAARVRVGTPA